MPPAPAVVTRAERGEPREARIFVYGTLKRGGAAGHLLRGCHRLGEAELSGTLYDVGGRFPALVLGGGRRVRGELWSCPAERLVELDAYEGVGEALFRRQRVEVGGSACWVYVAGPRLLPELRQDHVVADGSWPPPASPRGA